MSARLSIDLISCALFPLFTHHPHGVDRQRFRASAPYRFRRRGLVIFRQLVTVPSVTASTRCSDADPVGGADAASLVVVRFPHVSAVLRVSASSGANGTSDDGSDHAAATWRDRSRMLRPRTPHFSSHLAWCGPGRPPRNGPACIMLPHLHKGRSSSGRHADRSRRARGAGGPPVGELRAAPPRHRFPSHVCHK